MIHDSWKIMCVREGGGWNASARKTIGAKEVVYHYNSKQIFLTADEAMSDLESRMREDMK